MVSLASFVWCYCVIYRFNKKHITTELVVFDIIDYTEQMDK